MVVFKLRPWIHLLANEIYSGNFKRDPNQIWVVVNEESPVNSVLDIDVTKNIFITKTFNWSMSFNTHSTIYRPWFYIKQNKFDGVNESDVKQFESVKENIRSMNKSKDFCWIISNCVNDWAQRKEIANDLIKLLPSKIHIWGKFYNICLDVDAKANSIDYGPFPGRYQELYEPQQDKIKACKFYFSFENSICFDYITEKFVNSLEAGAIPIVNGWKDSYEERVPGSFIHISDFTTLTDLAEYLKLLLRSEDDLMNYHKWRLKYRVERLHLQPMCQLCENLGSFKTNPGIPTIIYDVEPTKSDMQNCTVFKRHDS